MMVPADYQWEFFLSGNIWQKKWGQPFDRPQGWVGIVVDKILRTEVSYRFPVCSYFL